MSLSTSCYSAANVLLSLRLTKLAIAHRRFGYRRILQLLRREGLCANHKRVYCVYQLNDLSVKRRRRREVLVAERLPKLRPKAPNMTWSMDFVMGALATGRRIKRLTCDDDFTKECLKVNAAPGGMRRIAAVRRDVWQHASSGNGIPDPPRSADGALNSPLRPPLR